MRKLKGFTLIELLVVIAIISILAAILFPVFARARENARKTSCLSNLKQLGLGVQMYSQDYDERITPGYLYWVPGDTNYLNSWMQLIMPYTKSAQLCACPSWSQPSGYSENGPNKQIPIPRQSYIAVANVAGLGVTTRSLSEFTRPAETIYGLDSKFCTSEGSFTSSYPCSYFYWGGAIPDVSLYLYSNAFNNSLDRASHMNGNNVFFVDGHAKWLNRTVPSNFDYDPS